MKRTSSLELRCQLTSESDCIYILHSIVQVMGDRAGLSSMETNRIALAVDELFANILQHGYHGSKGEIHLSVRRKPHALHFRFRDFALPIREIDLQQGAWPSVDGLKTGGLGMQLIRAVVDEFHHRPLADGNLWELIRYLPGKE